MTMPEMQKAITKLRFLLASIKGKEEELEGLSRQFRRQLETALSHAIRGDNSIDSTLSMLDEIQERLDKVERTRRHLDSIKSRAQDELRALELTARIEQAKMELATLRASDGAGQAGRHREPQAGSGGPEVHRRRQHPGGRGDYGRGRRGRTHAVDDVLALAALAA